MPRPQSLSYLNDQQWEELQSRACRLEEAWDAALAAGAAVDLRDYLPPPGSSDRPACLHELIKTELEIRWRHGQRPTLEDYAARFPELGTLAGLPPTLIYEEYRVRQRYGDRPALEAYRSRFPDQFEQLQRLLEERSLRPMSVTPPAPPTPPTPRPGLPSRSYRPGDRVGEYTLKQRLGSGAFAEVWRAEAGGGVLAVLKIVRQAVTGALSDTTQAALEKIKSLRHAFLLRVMGFWVEEGRLVIALEPAEGSLLDRAKACREAGLVGLPRDELLGYVKDSAEALDYLHAQGLIHRDIKPANILYVGKHAKVADLGLVRERGPEESLGHGAQRFTGTLAYMPREAGLGKPVAATDQFSLALTYAELRQGEVLHPQGNPAVSWMPMTGDEPDLSRLSPGERRVLQRALDPSPQRRYPSCVALAVALERAAEGAESAGWWTRCLRGLGLLRAPRGDTEAAATSHTGESARPTGLPRAARPRPRKVKGTGRHPAAAPPAPPAAAAADGLFGTILTPPEPGPGAALPPPVALQSPAVIPPAPAAEELTPAIIPATPAVQAPASAEPEFGAIALPQPPQPALAPPAPVAKSRPATPAPAPAAPPAEAAPEPRQAAPPSMLRPLGPATIFCPTGELEPSASSAGEVSDFGEHLLDATSEQSPAEEDDFGRSLFKVQPDPESDPGADR